MAQASSFTNPNLLLALIHLKLLSLLADSQTSHGAEWLSGTIHGLGEKSIRTGGALLHDNIPSNFSSLRLSVVDERSEQVYSLFWSKLFLDSL